jgi:hypothetical protein
LIFSWIDNSKSALNLWKSNFVEFMKRMRPFAIKDLTLRVSSDFKSGTNSLLELEPSALTLSILEKLKLPSVWPGVDSVQYLCLVNAEEIKLE